MADKAKKPQKLKARLPRGLADRGPAEIAATRQMVEAIRLQFERYGFEPVETPAIEYTDALGKFLPDQDRPNEGVFSFQDDDEQWLSLRYDLTAPLARHFAENFDAVAKPYRTYRFGWVFRNEKPGPGRFRQFMQFDADTVGAPTMAADAEMCMLAADTMEALGIPRGSYVVKVNNRKVLDGVLESIGLGGEENAGKRLTVLRAIDKLDRLGPEGVRQLLGEGRKDESGDFTKGAGLDSEAADRVLAFTSAKGSDAETTLQNLSKVVSGSQRGAEGVQELRGIAELAYGDGRVVVDPSVVRGLEYYTGPVYEVELTFEIPDEKGRPIRFGSYAPENFDLTFQGTVSVRKALQLSLNVPAVAVLDRVGAGRGCGLQRFLHLGQHVIAGRSVRSHVGAQALALHKRDAFHEVVQALQEVVLEDAAVNVAQVNRVVRT